MNARVDPTGKSLVELEQVLGLSSLSNAALSSSRGDCFYSAGCVCVRYNPLTNKQVSFYRVSKPISCLKVSPCGKYVAIGERGHLPCVCVWEVESGELLIKLSGHKHGIGCLSFSPDSEFIVSCGFKHDKQLLVWEWKNREFSEQSSSGSVRFSRHPVCAGKLGNKVNAIDYHESGTYFVTCGDRHLKFWNVEREGLVGSGRGNMLKLSGKPGSITEALKDGVFMDVVCGTGPVSNTIYCTTASGVLCAFHESRLMDKWLQLESRSSYCLTLFSKGNAPGLLVAGCAEGIIRAFDPCSLSYLATLPLPQPLRAYERELTYPACYGVRMVSGSPQAPAPKLCAIYADRSMFLWDISDLEHQVVQYRSFSYHRACIWDLALVDPVGGSVEAIEETNRQATPDDVNINSSKKERALPAGSFATCSADGTIRLWNLDKQEQRRSGWRNQFSREMLHCIELGDKDFNRTRSDSTGSNGNQPSPQRNRGSGAGAGDTSLDLSTGLPDCELPSFKPREKGKDVDGTAATAHNDSIAARCLAIHPSGQQVACGDRTGRVKIFNLRTMREVYCQHAHSAEVLSLCYAPVNVQSGENGAKEWGVVVEDDEDPSGVGASDVHRRISLLASAGRDRLIHVYDSYRNYSHVSTLDSHSGSITLVKFTPDGKRLLSCGGDKTLIITKVEGPAFSKIKTISSPQGNINGLAIEATNRFAIASGGDKRLSIYNIVNGKHVRTYKSPALTHELYKADIDPSGMFVVVTGFDKSINVFDFFSGELLTRMTGHADLITQVKFTRDGRRILSVSGDGTVMVWRVSEGLVGAMQERLMELHGQAARDVRKSQVKLSVPAKPDSTNTSASASTSTPAPAPAARGVECEGGDAAMPPPPPAPIASAPVPIRESDAKRGGASFDETVGLITPTIAATATATATAAAAATGEGTMPPPPPMPTDEAATSRQQEQAQARSLASTFASSGSSTTGPAGGAWKKDNTLEIFGRKLERDKKDLNRFSFELTSSAAAPVTSTEDAAEAEATPKAGPDPSPSMSANTQRLEDDDDVMMADESGDEGQEEEGEEEGKEEGEDEKERRFFAAAPRLTTDPDGLLTTKAEDTGTGIASEPAIEALEEDERQEQRAEQALDFLEQSVSEMEHWLENRLRSESAETESHAATTALASDSNTSLNENDGAHSQTALTSRSLSSEYMARVMRNRAKVDESATSLGAPASPSASTRGLVASPRSSRSANGTPSRSSAVMEKRRETTAALALMKARLQGMGVYEGNAAAGTAAISQNEVGEIDTNAESAASPAPFNKEGTQPTESESTKSTASTSSKKGRKVVKRKPRPASPPDSPTKDQGLPVPRERFPPSPSSGINAINVNNSIDMGRKRSGSGSFIGQQAGNSAPGTPPRDEMVLQATPPTFPSRPPASPSHTEVAPHLAGTSSSEELAVDSASVFDVEDHIPAASPRTAAASVVTDVAAPVAEEKEDDNDTDSTVTEDERDTSTMGKKTPGTTGEGEGEPLLPWDGDVTSPEADAAMAREVIRGIEEERKNKAKAQHQLDTRRDAEPGDELDEEGVQRALERHQLVLASLESAKEEALKSYSDLVQLQSSLIRASSSLSSPNRTNAASFTSQTSVPRVAQMMGAADTMLNSYRESLRFSLNTAGTGSSTSSHSLSPTRGSKGAVPATILEGTATVRLEHEGQTEQSGESSNGDATTVLTRSDAPISSPTGGADLGTSSPADLDELLERHSDKILHKLLSKLNPQQQELLSELN